MAPRTGQSLGFEPSVIHGQIMAVKATVNETDTVVLPDFIVGGHDLLSVAEGVEVLGFVRGARVTPQLLASPLRLTPQVRVPHVHDDGNDDNGDDERHAGDDAGDDDVPVLVRVGRAEKETAVGGADVDVQEGDGGQRGGAKVQRRHLGVDCCAGHVRQVSDDEDVARLVVDAEPSARVAVGDGEDDAAVAAHVVILSEDLEQVGNTYNNNKNNNDNNDRLFMAPHLVQNNN